MSLAVVLLPGSLCDQRLFAGQRDRLGVPSHVVDLTRDASIDAMVDRVAAEAPAEFAVLGLSLGGIVAAELVRRCPDRLLGVALVDTNLDAPDAAQLDTRERWAVDVRAGRFHAVVEEIAPMMTRFPERHGALVRDMAMAVGPEAFLRQNEALLHRHDRRSAAAAACGPLLVACGSDDSLCPPPIHAELAGRSPGADLVIVDDAGHLSTIDQPDALADAMARWAQMCINHQPRSTS